MAIPTTKEELQKAISKDYDKLQKELKSIAESDADSKELEGHAKNTWMSVHNLVSYLVGWGELVLKWNRMKTENTEVHFPEKGYKWNELGKLAQKFYKDYEKYSFAEIQEKLDQNVRKILELITSKSEAELYQHPWYERWTLGRMIQFNTSSPYKNATARIRQWKKQRKLK